MAVAGSGLVVDPDDEAGFIAAAQRLRDDAALRATLGSNGRNYAERTFDIQRIADQFEAILVNPDQAVTRLRRRTDDVSSESKVRLS